MNLEKSLGFQDIAILQRKCIVNSRSEINIESEIIKGVIRPIPIIASNMSTVVNADFINKLWDIGAFGVMHRAGTDKYIFEEIIKVKNHGCKWIGASIGISENQFSFAQKLISLGVNVINIDVAHGWCDRVLNLCYQIKGQYDNIKVIIGNVVNPGILDDIEKASKNIWPDAIKVGIGGGLGCSTALTAGCTKNQWSAIFDFKNQGMNIPLISDGNIKEPSDFVKAIGAGASSAMCGSVFARCPESAAEIVEINGVEKKIYQGMSSKAVQEKYRGKVHNDCPEGRTVLLPIGEPLEALLKRYAGALRSGISYSGFNNINDFKQNCEFIRI